MKFICCCTFHTQTHSLFMMSVQRYDWHTTQIGYTGNTKTLPYIFQAKIMQKPRQWIVLLHAPPFPRQQAVLVSIRIIFAESMSSVEPYIIKSGGVHISCQLLKSHFYLKSLLIYMFQMVSTCNIYLPFHHCRTTCQSPFFRRIQTVQAPEEHQ